jgi:hypothetical protein
MGGIGMPSNRTIARNLQREGKSVGHIATYLDISLKEATALLAPKPRKPLSRSAGKRRRQSVSPASPPQRSKVRDVPSVTGEEGPCDPAHLWPRSLGGCNDDLCVIPLTREEHRAFDEHRFDLLPHIVQRYPEEIAHAVLHAGGDLIAVLQRLTGTKWQPVTEESE